MGKRRRTPDGDIDRLVENLKNNTRGGISNRIEFLKAWESYMGDELTQLQDTTLRTKVMNAYSEQYNVSMIKFEPRRAEQIDKRIEKRVSDTRLFDIVATQKGRQIFAREIQTKAGMRLVDYRQRYAKRLP